MERIISNHSLVVAVAAVAMLNLIPSAARSQETVRLKHHVAGDSKPIVLEADEITTWTEGTQRFVVLKGLVLVEHGVVRARMRQGIVSIDQDRKKRAGIFQVEVYAEGNVKLEQGLETQAHEKAVLELSTRGDLKFKSHIGKVVQQTQANDPLVQRARVEMGLPPVAAATVIQRTSASAPAGPAVIPAQAIVPQPPPQTPVPAPAPPNPAPVGPYPNSAAPGPPVSPYNPLPAPAPGANPAPAPVPGPQGGVAPPPVPIPRGGTGPPPPGRRLGAAGDPTSLRISPRTSTLGWDERTETLPSGEQVSYFRNGIILTVMNATGGVLLDIEADRLVMWHRGSDTKQLLNNLKTAEGDSSKETEFYLSGNVEIREQTGPDYRILRASEVYYDVNRHVAVALRADLEMTRRGQPEPLHLSAEELLQLSPTLFKAVKAEVFSSKLPSDPGVKIYVADAVLEEKKVTHKSIFGSEIIDPKTGQPEVEQQRIFKGRNVFLELESVPIFYLPYVQGDANDPLGPLENISFGYDRIFGTQIKTSWDVYDLFGITPVAGTRWRLNADLLSDRGPALGTDFDYRTKELLGIPGEHVGMVRAYGIQDNGVDVIGFRGPNMWHPVNRGRFLWRENSLALPDDFTVQAQVSALSDKNFLEQYYKPEFDNDINQETFLYVKQQPGNMAWTVLGEQRIRNWVTETSWLPKADGYIIGQSFFDLLTYNAHASAGYGQLQTTVVYEYPSPTQQPTDVNTYTGRFDLWQDISLPFSLGAFRVVPYGVLDLTEYTADINGEERSRVYGGGGVRTSIPFTRLFPDVHSELFNVNGINHKIVFSSNFYVADTNAAFSQFAQLDRLDDDATDQSRRDINPLQTALNPAHGIFLANSPLYNLQTYAIRRLVDNRVDTLDQIEVLQTDIRQRWQTKRGYPGMQHIVDWMTLDLSASYFPHPTRDNFGEQFAFMQYDWTWNIGDRTTLASSGWHDPIEQGANVYNFGAYFNRPDRTNFYVGYREIYPVNSQIVIGAVSYIFSPKYAFTASTAYDFGTQQAQSNSFIFTRMGKDLQVSLGVTYNAILNNFGVSFEVFPNFVPPTRRAGIFNMLGSAR